jgi:DNA mismatch repair ATPase MutS
MMGGSIGPFVAVAILEAIFAQSFGRKIHQIVHSVDRPSGELDVLMQALLLVEREPVSSRRLSALRGTLESHNVPASRAIKRLHRFSEMHEWQHNLLFGMVAPFLLWSTQIALAIEAWRREFGSHVPEWIQTLGEYEALDSLAAYAYEHPADPFPAFVDEGPGTFEGIGLGHPLVPAAQMVSNDVQLADIRLLIVSGSNMSGKSTLLRTVGINVVLALAGAPVRAKRVALTRLNVGATLRIQDSLQAGRSRFFAEISRVRRIVDLAKGPTPLVFLLDELLQGTNSHDRAIGAAAVVRTLVGHGAIGLITTHDLALTSMADHFEGRAVNVHFEDHFEHGELAFDYRMRPGPVTRSNALALMRTVGLDVDE